MKMSFSITKNGKSLDKSLYTWDETTQTLSTKEDYLVLDFSGYNNCTFKTGNYCTFNTGSYCTFITGSGCTFDAGYDCTFNTGSFCTFDTGFRCTFDTNFHCTFKTGSDCTFSTSSDCTFSTSYNCTFKTGDGCIFDSDDDCTFNTGDDCTFNTSHNCTFYTGSDCTFNTNHSCIFNTGNGCTFKTKNGCTFNTGSDCTFSTGNNCIFNTDYGCIFNTSYNCTFRTDYGCTFNTDDGCTFITGFGCTFNTKNRCVIVKRDIFEFYNISNVKNLTTAPYRVKGYIKNGYYYKDGEKQYKAVIADGILSEVIEHKGNVYKVKNHGSDNISYLVKNGDVYSHGKTVKEAKESLIYKLSNRDTSVYKDYKLDTKVSKKEAIQMYRAITGACESGTRYFVERLREVPESLTIKEIIELTKGQYGNDTFRKFFEEANE